MVCLQLGCIEKVDPKFKPGDDPFVRKLFEQHLADVGIMYKIDAEGFYTSSQENIEKMRPISNKAFSEAMQTSSLEVKPGCSFEKLLHQLDDGKVVYVVDNSREPYLVKTTTVDAKKFHIMESYVGTQAECEGR
jgi:hypothetical protein